MNCIHCSRPRSEHSPDGSAYESTLTGTHDFRAPPNFGACIQDYINACTRHRAKLVVQAHRKGAILSDQDYDDVAGFMAMWKGRYRKATNCGQALCPVHGDERDHSATLLMEAALLPDSEACLDPSLAIPEPPLVPS